MHRDIKIEDVLIAQLYDMNSIEGVEFPTPSEATFQFGFGQIIEDKNLLPHIHKRVNREINTTSEFLYVVSGEMIVDVYDENEKFIEKVILKDNMALLQFIGGHEISLRAGTKYFEIKQGPYFGRDFDKYDFKK
ncbi:hypothetical protein [Marinifilum flexuosum]|uniref:hypothetical protein n=1 Tax=Marinifilum flexuosum TaxID=1117708 RepID=UPI002494A43F|nr:hypothetical protein [Marinifilum flexuosum]